MAHGDKLGDNTRKEYWDSVRSTAKEIAKEVKAGDLSQDELSERLDQEADGSYWVIYTHANFATLWFSDNWTAIDDAIDEGIVELGSYDSFLAILPVAAFFAYRRDLEEQVEAELA